MKNTAGKALLWSRKRCFLLEATLQASPAGGAGLGWTSRLSFPTAAQKCLFLKPGTRLWPSENILYRRQTDLQLLQMGRSFIKACGAAAMLSCQELGLSSFCPGTELGTEQIKAVHGVFPAATGDIPTFCLSLHLLLPYYA